MIGICYGQDYDYASSRIKNTIVKYEGLPVYVQYLCPEEGYADISTPWGSDQRRVNSEDLDMSPIPLGIVNVANDISFIMRKPARHYKQGLDNENTKTMLAHVNLFSKQVYNTMVGVFPSVVPSFEELMCEECRAKGVSRNFAFGAPMKNLSETLPLLFRTTVVGEVSLSGDATNINYSLDKGFDYLNEMLEKELNV